jgi:hypothetical protein
MLWTIAVILFILWALGLATAYTVSGFIHVLLVIAIVIVLLRVIQGRRALVAEASRDGSGQLLSPRRMCRSHGGSLATEIP